MGQYISYCLIFYSTLIFCIYKRTQVNYLLPELSLIKVYRIQQVILQNILKFMLKYGEMVPITASILVISNILAVQACLNDTKCINCQPYQIQINLTMNPSYLCQKCVDNSYLNPLSLTCQCQNGYFSFDQATCSPCSNLCKSCTSSYSCQSCFIESKRQLVNNLCVCIDGFQETQESPQCRQKASVLMIVLSSIGSFICMIVGILFIVCLKIGGQQQKIHIKSKKSGEREVNEQQIQNSSNMQQTNIQVSNNSSYFWRKSELFMPYRPNQVCSVCLQLNTYFMTECGHYFHGKCIFSWLENKNYCPNCQKVIQTKQIRRWCQKCKSTLMPTVMQVSLQKLSKKKKAYTHSSPIQSQYCDRCEKASNQKINLLSKQIQINKDRDMETIT